MGTPSSAKTVDDPLDDDTDCAPRPGHIASGTKSQRYNACDRAEDTSSTDSQHRPTAAETGASNDAARQQHPQREAMIIILPLLAGVAIGAVVTAVVDRRRCNAHHSDRRPNPTRREDTAISRDLNERRWLETYPHPPQLA